MHTTGQLHCALNVRRLAALALFWVAAPLTLPAAAATFEDGRGGATCYFFSAAGLLEWQHRGGDWVDAQGAAQGDQAFALARIVPRTSPQSIVLDVLALVEQWERGGAVSGAMVLRALGGAAAKAGTVTFSSREAKDQANTPSLVLRWDDGRADRLAPTADTYFSCPTHRSLGSEALVLISETESALLEFPFAARPGQRVLEASLLLTSPKQFGRGLTVGTFGARLPGGGSTAARETGLSDALLRDAGVADLPDVLYAEDFEDATRWRVLLSDPSTQASLATVAADRDNGFEALAGKALRVTIRRDTDTALNHHFRFARLAGGEPDEAYFRYYLRLGNLWDPVVDGGKLPGFAGIYSTAGWGQRRADGSNGWSARGAFMRSAAAGVGASAKRAIGTYVYAANTEGGLGEIWGWNLGPTGLLEKDRWYAVEQHVKLNTPGLADGVLRVWVDGQLALERANLRYRDTPKLKIESVWMNVFHGGTTKADRDLTLYIDNLVIARRYIGPGRFGP